MIDILANNFAALTQRITDDEAAIKLSQEEQDKAIAENKAAGEENKKRLDIVTATTKVVRGSNYFNVFGQLLEYLKVPLPKLGDT